MVEDINRDVSSPFGATKPPMPALPPVVEQPTGEETGTNREFRLSLLWHRFCAGAYRVGDRFSSTDRHYLVAEYTQVEPVERSALLVRRWDALRSVLSGSTRKAVASDSSLSDATVATDLQRALGDVGCTARPSQVPLIFALAAHAAAHPQRNFDARCTEVLARPQLLHVISTERPELRLAHRLTPIEFEVVQLLLHGGSHREIAEARNVSTRTIANQLASVYARLRVSGRMELLSYIVTL